MKLRLAVAMLSLSAGGLVGTALHESYVSKAVIPVKGDRWTVGYGSTYRDDGSPVQAGDTITPPRALVRMHAHIERDEIGIRQCVTAPLTQGEYDLLVDFAYQYGAATLCTSSIVRHLNAGRYAESCGAYLLYKFAGGYDCSTPGNTRCPGVWARSQARHARCMGEQS